MKVKSTPKKEVVQKQEEEASNSKHEISNSQMIEFVNQQLIDGNAEDVSDKVKKA